MRAHMEQDLREQLVQQGRRARPGDTGKSEKAGTCSAKHSLHGSAGLMAGRDAADSRDTDQRDSAGPGERAACQH